MIFKHLLLEDTGDPTLNELVVYFIFLNSGGLS